MPSRTGASPAMPGSFPVTPPSTAAPPAPPTPAPSAVEAVPARAGRAETQAAARPRPARVATTTVLAGDADRDLFEPTSQLEAAWHELLSGPSLDAALAPVDRRRSVMDRLPPNARAFFDLAERRGFQLPETVRAVLDAAIWPGVDFPCITMAQAATDATLGLESARQALRAEGGPVPAGPQVSPLAWQRYFMIGCIAGNARDCIVKLRHAYEDPSVQGFALAALEFGAMCIHGYVYQQATRAERIVQSVQNRPFVERPEDLASGQDPFQNQALADLAAEKSDEFTRRVMLKGDSTAALVLSMAHYLLMNQLLDRRILPGPGRQA